MPFMMMDHASMEARSTVQGLAATANVGRPHYYEAAQDEACFSPAARVGTKDTAVKRPRKAACAPKPKAEDHLELLRSCASAALAAEGPLLLPAQAEA